MLKTQAQKFQNLECPKSPTSQALPEQVENSLAQEAAQEQQTPNQAANQSHPLSAALQQTNHHLLQQQKARLVAVQWALGTLKMPSQLQRALQNAFSRTSQPPRQTSTLAFSICQVVGALWLSRCP